MSGLVRAYLSQRNAKDTASAEILSQLLEPALFKQIRTESISLSVGFFKPNPIKTKCYCVFYFSLQAQRTGRSRGAFQWFFAAKFSKNSIIASIKQQEFATTKNSVLISLTQPPKNLKWRNARYIGDWRERITGWLKSELIEALNKRFIAKTLSNFYDKLEVRRSNFGATASQMRVD